MSQFANYGENKVADFFRGQGLTLPAAWYVGLGSAATDSSFTELTGTAYARVTYTRSLGNFAGTQGVGTTLASSGTSHASSNNNAIAWPDPGSAWGTATYVGFFDASTAGNCWMWFQIPAIVIVDDSPQTPVEILAGALTFTLGLNIVNSLSFTTGCSDYLANKLIDLIFRAQAYTWPVTTYTALYTTAPTNAGGGTEVSASPYARQPIVSSMTAWSGTQSAGSTVASSGTSGRISNNAAVTYPAPSANWGTVVAEALRDAATVGNLLFWADVTPRSVLNGGPAPSHAANSIGLTVA